MNKPSLHQALRHIFLLWLLLVAEAACFAQTPQRAIIKSNIATYFATYDLGFRSVGERNMIEDIRFDEENKQVVIIASEAFAMQPFTKQKVERIYQDVRERLAGSFNDFQICIFVKNYLIDDLVPGGTGSQQRNWGEIRHKGNAWVTPLDRPYRVNEGLEDCHLCLWSSHGKVYSLKDQEWQWQRPHLWCTTEDLLSQTFVIPFLMPMLENAGAIVYSPRERDWQKHEVIVDNDAPNNNGIYFEVNGHHEWTSDTTGFALTKSVYTDGENPFADGTARIAPTHTRRSQTSSIFWIPDIPEDGDYAVYVSYTTLPTSVNDACYTVCHGGQTSRFRVNQQMGGGTWVYLGTFFFRAGNSQDNCVILSNQSDNRGHVSGDAVRFGGGMGNIARGDSLTLSGLPRFLEGSRYAAQWAGAPYKVYANKDATNDYAEDINVRSGMENYLARGSEYVPGDSGLCVPIELSLAFHTDAGYTTDSSFIGTLGIYTTDFNDGFLPSGLSRLTSRDVCDQVMTQVCSDMTAQLGHWSRRQMFDRNYSETREPLPPSIILEMLSHQNFNDMCKAHDPYFKFLMARAIYKGILRSVHALHHSDDITVQPLPVSAPSALIDTDKRRITLSWVATVDSLEPTAVPTGFVVYHAQDNGDFDNGTLVSETTFTLANADIDVLHRFRITACNKGGQSMPSQELCAYIHEDGGLQVLIVDAFDRLAGPQPFDNDTVQGFDMAADIGVPIAKMPGYCGRQINSNKRGMGREGPGALGYSTSEFEGLILAGNTMDWATRHARDLILAANGCVNIGSCSSHAAERTGFDTSSYQLMDIACGLTRADGYSLRQSKTFSPAMMQAVAEHTRRGGSILVSGAYIGSDMTSADERLFTATYLKYACTESLSTDCLTDIAAQNTSFNIYRTPNEQSYCVQHIDCLQPVNGAFCPLLYAPFNKPAAVAYNGTDYHSYALGFPLESIIDGEARVSLLRGILQFLVP